MHLMCDEDVYSMADDFGPVLGEAYLVHIEYLPLCQ